MGSYSYLRVGDLTLSSTKRDVDPTVLMLFTEEDRRDWPYTDAQVSQGFDCDDPAAFVEKELEGEWPMAAGYVASLTVVKDRLDFMGVTLAAVREEFEAGIQEELESLEALVRGTGMVDEEFMRNAHASKETILRRFTFERWLEAFAFVINNYLHPSSVHSLWHHAEHADDSIPEDVRFLLSESFGEGVWFPSYDFRMLMRAAVEITGTAAEIVYDLSELYTPAELDENDLTGWARREMAEEFVINHKVVVLAEGHSDIQVIRGSLQLLFPHLVEYYSFFDFAGTKAQGGAGTLVGTIKAFVGAGIVNRIVALFDNDTAARAALRALKSDLPATVRVLHYPHAPWAEAYPTLGPQGLLPMNVNGLAGSLEMYFGVDVLRRSDGNLVPVQWRGYDEGMKQYQGELMYKAELHERFERKLQHCLDDPTRVPLYDWSGMRLILDHLRTAFH
jgi:hypothetical protein